MRRDLLFAIAWRTSVIASVALLVLAIYAEFSPKRSTAVPLVSERTVMPTAPDPKSGAVIEDIWKPAATPPGGVSWTTLEATGETTRTDAEGYIVSKPQFTAAVKALEGERIMVAGWMMPLENGEKQKHFVLLAYPPGCPFHFHAMPNQFIEVFADTPFPTDESKVQIVSGVLELTGYDESGIFYRLRKAQPE